MNKQLLFLLTLTLIIFLPACRRIKLKQLPPIPARQKNTLHVEARILDQNETYDYLGFNLDTESPLCAWHLIIYNPTDETLITAPHSWSITPKSIDEIQAFVKTTYWHYMPLGLVTGSALAAPFTYQGYVIFTQPSGFIAGIRNFFVGSLYIEVAIAIFIITPLISYYARCRQIKNHMEALIPQLFPMESIVPVQNNIQGIVLLPKKALVEPWLFTIFDTQKNTYNFIFNGENNHE